MDIRWPDPFSPHESDRLCLDTTPFSSPLPEAVCAAAGPGVRFAVDGALLTLSRRVVGAVPGHIAVIFRYAICFRRSRSTADGSSMRSAATARPFGSFRRVPGQYVLLRQRSRAAGVLHFRRHAFLPHSSEHNGAQIFHCPAFEARYLYLRYGEDPRAVALRQAMKKPEIDYLLLLFRQAFNGRAER